MSVYVCECTYTYTSEIAIWFDTDNMLYNCIFDRWTFIQPGLLLFLLGMNNEILVILPTCIVVALI